MPTAVGKTFVLLSCTFLGLICGTLYLYSLYSPQLARRLNYLATDSLSIALFGSLGVAVSGPLAGAVVDRKGYTVALVVGGAAIVGGYAALRRQYDTPFSHLQLLCCALFVVGCGSTFINSACLKCCAVTFPSIRGVATSLPLALYGLSAMFYSVVALVFYQGDTLGFLHFLMLSLCVIFGVCCPSVMMCDRRRRRTGADVELSTLPSGPVAGPHSADGPHPPPLPNTHRRTHSGASASTEQLSGLRILATPHFWLLFVATGSLASLGQMYIYSVGYMVKALVTSTYQLPPEAQDNVQLIEILVQHHQQLQVSLLSLANCVGRLAAGVLGDVITLSFRKPRAWLLFLPAIGLAVTQIMALNIDNQDHLGAASMLTGFFYGYTLCLMPIIVGDVFGMDYFSQNWGLVGLAPVVPSFYFTNLFGKVYDLRSVVDDNGKSSCLQGRQCYNLVFELTLGVGVLAVAVVALFNFGDHYVRRRLSRRLSVLKEQSMLEKRLP